MTYEQYLEELIKENEDIIILTAENRSAIRNLPQKINGKFIDVGIAEQTMIGVSAGLALRGRIPIVHSLAAFLTMRAFEFIRTDIGIAHLPVKLVGAVPGFLSEANGPTHQAIEDISLMRGIPGVNIFTPADEDDLLIGLKDIILSPDPFYIRFNDQQIAFKHSEDFQIGRAELIMEGDDLTILTYGTMLSPSYEAALALNMKGISVRLLNLRTLKPIDEELICASADETKAFVTIEDHFLTGGLYSIVSELLVKNNLSIPVYPIALNNRWFKPALLKEVLSYEGFDSDSIAKNIIQFYEEKLETTNSKSLI